MTRTHGRICVFFLLTTLLVVLGPTFAQEGAQKPAEPVERTAKEKAAAPEKDASKPELPFQIQLLETHVRFEINGDSCKEVHTIVKINNVLGAHQFARLTFDYNRAFQQVEIPLVRVSHANGGTSELLPSAVTDALNPAVEKFPAYQDVRVQSVRILGLQEGDTIEYRVISTTTKHPLAPDFWLEHTFDRSGQVLEEIYELDFPASRPVQVAISPLTPPTKASQSGEGDSARKLLRWSLSAATAKVSGSVPEGTESDVVLTTFSSWKHLATRLGERIVPNEDTVRELYPKAKELVGGKSTADEWLNSFYDFVSQKVLTVDLPLGATGFRTRSAAEILSSGYATPEDKFALFAALGNNYCGPARAGLVNSTRPVDERDLPRPSIFDHLLTMSGYPSISFWMDLNLEVAPYRMIASQFRKKRALLVGPAVTDIWPLVLDASPFTAFQKVAVDAVLADNGQLKAKVKYTLRGDNELLLRVAFHQTAKEKWKDVAGLLAISDGFRGQVTSVNVSDPMATKDPFTVEYEIAQPKFVDWSKRPVRIPALLPQIGLPDPPAKTAAGEVSHTIELGTPLDVDTQMTLKLPAGATAQAPARTTVDRDYARFSSNYSTAANTVTATRRVNFLLREIPGDRAMDYSAFVRAVQSDQAQVITLVREAVEEKK